MNVQHCSIVRSLELVGITSSSHPVHIFAFYLQKLLIPCIQNYTSNSKMAFSVVEETSSWTDDRMCLMLILSY